MSSNESDEAELTKEQLDDLFAKRTAHLLVRKYDDDEMIYFRLLYKYKTINKGRLKIKEKLLSFKRPSNEPISVFMGKMKLSIAKFVLGHKMFAKSRAEQIADSSISSKNLTSIQLFYKDQDLIKPTSSNVDLLKYDEQDLRLIINDSEYKVYTNPQFISSCKLPKVVLNDFEIFPFIQMDFKKSNLEPLYGWFKRMNRTHPSYFDFKQQGRIESGLLKLGDQLTYTPSKDDIGCELIFKATSRLDETNNLETYQVESRKVMKSPDYFPYEKRHEFTKNKTGPNEIRVVSYNILADMYSDSKTAREELFKHCPAQFLTMDYRKHLLLKELIGYNADLICLQEVDSSVFDKHLEPALKLKTNLAGLISLKNDMNEGAFCCVIKMNYD